MAAARLVEPVYIFKDRHLSLAPCLPRMLPDQLCFDGLEERLDRRVVIAIALAAH